MEDLRNRHRERMSKSDKFQAIFGKSLSRYLHPIFGFDVVKFDTDIATPDGISTADFITQGWGIEATNLVLSLLLE